MSLIAKPSAARADEPERYYGYCATYRGEKTGLANASDLVYSSVLRFTGRVNDVGVCNSFNSYVTAELGGYTAACTCYSTLSSEQEAADKRNHDISMSRAKTTPRVRTVLWTYRGD